MSTTLYVSITGSNSNNGSQSSPFLTIAAASAAAQPGTTIVVAPGTYSGGFETIASGTAAAPINYVSQVPYGAIIVGGGKATNPNQAGWENERNYVNIRGFNINGTGSAATSWAFGFYTGASYVTFEGNEVNNIMTDPTAYANLTSAGNGGAGVMMDSYYGGSSSNVLGNLVFNIGPAGTTSTLVHGIYQTQSGLVEDNVVHNVVGDGITSWHNATNIQIINNTVVAVGGSGILVGSNGAGTGNNFVVNNNIVDGAAYGIYEEGVTGSNNSYSDNLLHNISGTQVHLQNGLTAKGTIYGDPMFVAPTSFNYQLQANSPAINAGTSADAPATDFLGIQSPQGGGYDLGAYDYVAAKAASAPSPNDTVVDAGSSAAIVDVAGNNWTIAATDQVAVNGVADPTTTGVTQLAYVNGEVWEENDSDLWFGKTSPTAAWSPSAGTSTSPLPTSVTIGQNQTSATVSQDGISIVATAGNHAVFISGSSNTVTLAGGTNTITDTGGRNIYVLPAAGKGFDAFTNNILTDGDTLDLRTALSQTKWNGPAATLSRYLTVADSSQGAVLSIQQWRHGTPVGIASIGGATTANLTTVLAHALT